MRLKKRKVEMVTHIDFFIDFPRTVLLVPLHSVLFFLTKDSTVVSDLPFKPTNYVIT